MSVVSDGCAEHMQEVAQISVYPANAEDARLMEALLSRMKVRCRVGREVLSQVVLC